MTLTVGTLLGSRYRIVSILGQGGMGAVYRALDENLGVEVAVKENLFLTDKYAKQFQLEASLLANLRHSNLPRVGDYFILDGQGQYLVMDFIGGEDLRNRIERLNVLPEKEVIMIGVVICDALAYLHTRQPPVIHRDIKPGNLKITSDGDVYLVDFGLAKVMTDSQATTTGARAMTPGFSPPEQYGIARTDARSDIYSLGATLYASLTGIIPEDGLARATGKEQLTPLDRLRPGINRKLAITIEKALAIEVEERFQTDEEFKLALLEAGGISKIPTGKLHLSPPPNSTPPFVPEKGAHNLPNNPSQEDLIITGKNGEWKASAQSLSTKKRLVGGSVIFSAILATVTIVMVLFPTLPHKINTHYFPLILANFRSSSLPMPTISTESIAIQEFSSTPGMSLSLTKTSVQDAFVMNTLHPTRISTFSSDSIDTETPGPVPTPSVTPYPQFTSTLTSIPVPTLFGGGTGEIAYASDISGSMQIWLVKGDGSSKRTISNVLDGACQPNWSPDGKKILFITPCSEKLTYYPGTRIYILDLETSVNEEIPLPEGSRGIFDPAMSPDGTKVAFSSMEGDLSQIFVYDIKVKTFRRISDSHLNDRQPAWSPDSKYLVFVRQFQFSQIWWVNLDTNEITQFSPNSAFNAILPAWDPDGVSVVYSQVQTGTNPNLIRIMVSGREMGQEELVTPAFPNSSIPVAEANFSPDRNWLAFEGWGDGVNHDIYIMTPLGNQLTRLTTETSYEFGPVWRPGNP
jgi:serine/threonine protein kinase/Tol biopolymer transport system component